MNGLVLLYCCENCETRKPCGPSDHPRISVEALDPWRSMAAVLPDCAPPSTPLAGQALNHALPAEVDRDHFTRGTGGREPPIEPDLPPEPHQSLLCPRLLVRSGDRGLTGEPCAGPPDGPGVDAQGSQRIAKGLLKPDPLKPAVGPPGAEPGRSESLPRRRRANPCSHPDRATLERGWRAGPGGHLGPPASAGSRTPL